MKCACYAIRIFNGWIHFRFDLQKTTMYYIYVLLQISHTANYENNFFLFPLISIQVQTHETLCSCETSSSIFSILYEFLSKRDTWRDTREKQRWIICSSTSPKKSFALWPLNFLWLTFSIHSSHWMKYPDICFCLGNDSVWYQTLIQSLVCADFIIERTLTYDWTYVNSWVNRWT